MLVRTSHFGFWTLKFRLLCLFSQRIRATITCILKFLIRNFLILNINHYLLLCYLRNFLTCYYRYNFLLWYMSNNLLLNNVMHYFLIGYIWCKEFSFNFILRASNCRLIKFYFFTFCHLKRPYFWPLLLLKSYFARLKQKICMLLQN